MILTKNRVDKTYSCTTPGSVIILGEHSILKNHRAHILAVDKTLTVNMSLLEGEDCAAISHPNNQILSIKSKLGEYKTTVENIKNTRQSFPKKNSNTY